jgi:tetratricopeptide (TPR) repeat protein
MNRKFALVLGGIFTFVLLPALPVPAADDPGQADLDQATDIKIAAETLADLEKVVSLCESAIRKGLSKENEPFAKQLLASTLYQHASKLSSAIFDQTPPDPRWPALRQLSVRNLEKALKYDSSLSEVHYLYAKLQALPGGDRKASIKSVGDAVKLAKDDKDLLSKALLLRGELSEDQDQRLADFNQAVLISPRSAEALRVRGLYHLVSGETEKAIEDLKKLVEVDDESVIGHNGLAEAYTGEKKFDEALKHIAEALKINPEQSLSFTLRARVHVLKNDLKAALADLDTAIKTDPTDVSALLLRARLRQAEGNDKTAEEDVAKALKLRPGLPQGILMRSMMAAAAGKFGDAIADIERLLKQDPKNVEFRLQLATYHSADGRPRKAAALFGEIVEEDPENWIARRGRGDALLSFGKQAEAITDYEAVLKVEPDHSGVLNNLAWVLATSPDEKLRNAKRSIELGKRACEVTDYKRPHILSTLAAGYAESGDFETAIKWSSKAVELGDDETIKEQLQKELDSYKQKKPWRELQETKEKPEPPKSGGDFEL